VLIFSALWIPVFYVFWLVVKPRTRGNAQLAFLEKICALAVGILIGIIRFFLINFVEPGRLGFSCILSSFFDYAAFPVLIPMLACLVFYNVVLMLYKEDYKPDWTGFVLLAAIPQILSCDINWAIAPNPIKLILPPVLWTSFAVLIHPIFRFTFKRSEGMKKVIIVLRGITGGILTAGFLVLITVIWWKFFVQENLPAAIMLLALLFLKAAITIFFLKTRRK